MIVSSIPAACPTCKGLVYENRAETEALRRGQLGQDTFNEYIVMTCTGGHSLQIGTPPLLAPTRSGTHYHDSCPACRQPFWGQKEQKYCGVRCSAATARRKKKPNGYRGIPVFLTPRQPRRPLPDH